jgi:MoaA/NifB/PqqE/SkfB family radical SAM enzyme
LEVFEHLVPAFKKTQLVFLQGWGEPFLNPDLLKMARMAKEAGCKVGTTTNGMLLNAETIYKVVECGMDVLAFSLAGVDKRNDEVRQGTSFDRVLEDIRILHETKKKLGKELPAVHIAYMLLRSKIGDIERLPLALQGLGVSQIVVSTLDFVPCEELAGETIIASTVDEYEELKARLDAVKMVGKQWGMRLHYQIHRPGELRLTCTENVLRAFFVSSDGMVSPCVFVNLPVSQKNKVCRDGKRRYRRLTFGNIGDAPIGDIWRKKAYRGFRKAFYENRLPSICEDCPKLFVR